MCRATVKQVGDSFIPGAAEHCHPAEPNTTTVHQIRAAVMEEACNNIFRPAGEIVSKAMRKHLDTSKPYPSLSNPSHLARTANRQRQMKRPTDQTELCFTLDIDFIGQDFLQSDIHVCGNRHLIFATTAQLDILFKCRHWFIDSTFKVV
ncbi:hypothetical protein Pmani_010214 [Petrolisthes manimaculis]|uniref:Uncharacterized protein n=1 Tax=Petrolisthes manimaculis TaxID=1843537 RepID=A0AAE1Q349_9EUCA|nr:hypothetical protein Pmani_010214 [Petrolisthes manimaculis]